jgi:hypothetical protein
MVSLRQILCAGTMLVVTAFAVECASAAEEFPFGTEMSLEVAPQPGSKRIPNIEIGDNGEVVLELWCKGGKGQFSIAGSTVIFVPGQIQDRSCPPAKAQADDDLVAALSEVATWKRQGEFLTLIGPKPLRFRLNGN